MPVIDVGQPTWQYDTVAKTLLATFTEPCPRNASDPAKWRPKWSYQVSIPVPGNVAKFAYQDPNVPPPVEPPPVP